ncbi:MAG: hypothetical protein KAG61_12945 [Bacteriovoracaceae bacterium]|nr:hypothetical protein [Bacteriovoracaceae bacterium]
MNKKDFDPLKILDITNNIQNAAGGAMFNTHSCEEVKVNIRPNKDVALGKFKSDPLLPGCHIAHPITIEAMRKDLFVLGDEFIDLELKYECIKCRKELDLQFWMFCPYCETPFPSDL